MSHASGGYHIDKTYTTLELVSPMDCNETYRTAALVVWGGAYIGKTASVGDLIIRGDTVIEGNLIANDMFILNDVVIGGNAVVAHDFFVGENLTVDGSTIFVGPVTFPANVSIVLDSIILKDLTVTENTYLFGNVVISGETQLVCDTLLPSVNLQTTNATTTPAISIPTTDNTSYLVTINCIGMRADRAATALFKLNAAFCNDSGVLRKINVDDVLEFNDAAASGYNLSTGVTGTTIIGYVTGLGATVINWSVCVSYVILSI